MKGYKTSKDYKLLKELLDKGYKVIGSAWHRLELFYKHNDSEYQMGGSIPTEHCEICKEEIDRDYSKYFDYFKMCCETRELEFIEPTEE